MKLVFAEQAWEDYLHWQRTDRKNMLRVNELIVSIERELFSGIGKPEPLRFHWTGWWSRRIDSEHRLVYKVECNLFWIAQCRYHC